MEMNKLDRSIFREYDIRGVYPTQINEEAAYTIGRNYGSYIQENLKRKICGVGRDNRLPRFAVKNFKIMYNPRYYLVFICQVLFIFALYNIIQCGIIVL